MDLARAIAGFLVPPLCAACGGPCPVRETTCEPCGEMLRAIPPPLALPPPGIEQIHSAATHDGVARDLVVALKFHRLLPVAGLLAGRILDSSGGRLPPGAVVPVPPAPMRLRRRGFDPADEIATALALLAGRRIVRCLARRGGPRQVGRPRELRLAQPPVVRAIEPVPAIALIVDDVTTTGATLGACALALREAGAERVFAATFALKLREETKRVA